jgi:hypothetical protein
MGLPFCGTRLEGREPTTNRKWEFSLVILIKQLM